MCLKGTPPGNAGGVPFKMKFGRTLCGHGRGVARNQPGEWRKMLRWIGLAGSLSGGYCRKNQKLALGFLVRGRVFFRLNQEDLAGIGPEAL